MAAGRYLSFYWLISLKASHLWGRGNIQSPTLGLSRCLLPYLQWKSFPTLVAQEASSDKPVCPIPCEMIGLGTMPISGRVPNFIGAGCLLHQKSFRTNLRGRRGPLMGALPCNLFILIQNPSETHTALCKKNINPSHYLHIRYSFSLVKADRQ